MRYRAFGIGALLAGSLALGACKNAPESLVTSTVMKIGDLESYEECNGTLAETRNSFLIHARWSERLYIVTALQCETTTSAFDAVRKVVDDELMMDRDVRLTMPWSNYKTTTPRICVTHLEFNITDKEASGETLPAEAPVGKK